MTAVKGSQVPHSRGGFSMTNAVRSARRRRLGRALSAVALVMLFLECSPRANARQAPANDLDTFMEKVLARRKVNQDALKDYVLNDVEQFEAVGPGEFTLFRSKREYLWYVRDGVHVRSPVRMDGVTIGSSERKEYEDKWIRQEQIREKRRAEAKAKSQNAVSAVPEDAAADQSPPDPSSPSFITQISEPRFVSEAYFLDFKFESGNYYLAGREKHEGRDVLVIEYYPSDLFNDNEPEENAGKQQKEEKPQKERSKKEQEREERINRQMNKTSLVTLWVDPAEQQIVKYTFSNVWMDFLPAGWMLRVDHLKASMEMSQAIPGVWLPRNISIQAGVSLAVGLYTVKYDRRFSDYKRAEVTTTIRPSPSDQEKQ
jgi:hypothetical protein